MNRIFHICCRGLTLLLLTGLIGLWIRSFETADAISWQRWYTDAGTYRGKFRSLYCGRGVVGIELIDLTTAFPSKTSTDAHVEWNRYAAAQFLVPRETLWQRLGFGYVSTSQASVGLRNSMLSRRAYWIPHWLAVLVVSLAPLRWLGKWLVRVRRRRHGRCVACGYDLRFTPDRCPECGLTVFHAPEPGGSSPPAEAAQ